MADLDDEVVDYEDVSMSDMTRTGNGALAHASLGDAIQAGEQKTRIINDTFPRYVNDMVNSYSDNVNWSGLVDLHTQTFSTARLEKKELRSLPKGHEKLDMALGDIIRLTKKLHVKNKKGRRAKFTSVVNTDDYQYKALSELLTRCYAESPTYTLRLVFHIRDARKGKGRRDVFRMCMKWYVDNKHEDDIRRFIHLVPEYGRWDDLLYCPGGIDHMARQLVLDSNALQSASGVGVVSVSLVSKWVPTQGNKRRGCLDDLKEALRKQLGREKFDDRDYRRYVQPMRAHLKLVETQLCKRKYDTIEYSKVPSRAMALYSKQVKSANSVHEKRRVMRVKRLKTTKDPKDGGAFVRHDGKRLEAFNTEAKAKLAKIQAAIASGEMKEEEAKAAIAKVIKFDQLYPHELVTRYMNGEAPNEDATLENQWSAWVAKLSTVKALKDVVAMVDVSGSMDMLCSPGSNVTCMNVSVALGLLISRCSGKDWANQMLTFQTQPELVTIDPALSLYDAVQVTRNMSWGGSTNIEAAFNLLLDQVVNGKKTMPRALIVLTDMNFDPYHAGYNQATPFQAAKRKYEQAGQQLPIVVFWNLHSNTMNCYPVQATTPGTILLSGFSTASLELLFADGKDWDNFTGQVAQPLQDRSDEYDAVVPAAPLINPWTAVAELLDSDRYRAIIV